MYPSALAFLIITCARFYATYLGCLGRYLSPPLTTSHTTLPPTVIITCLRSPRGTPLLHRHFARQLVPSHEHFLLSAHHARMCSTRALLLACFFAPHRRCDACAHSSFSAPIAVSLFLLGAADTRSFLDMAGWAGPGTSPKLSLSWRI